MAEKSVNYYGYEKSSYLDCLDLIYATNGRHMRILNAWFLVITGIYTYFSWQNSFGLSEENFPMFIGFFVSICIFEFVLLRFGSFIEKYSLIASYINMLALMSLGILCSVSQPYMAATIYLVILVLVALSYIDTLIRMGVVTALASAVFLFFSYSVKPGSIFNQDVFNVLVVYILTIIFHYMFQRARMRQFITFREGLKMQQELEVKSSFDALTSLLNRGRFFSMASEVIRNQEEECIALGLLDLDKFKQINDTLGHQMGDKVIQIAGKTILNTLNVNYGEKWSFPERAVKESENFAGRLGGDEFVVLIRSVKDKDETEKLFQDLLKNLNAVQLEGLDGINSSIGITLIKKGDADMDRAYSRADEALYKSKESGRNRITFAD
ncbi:MAG: GGDEF domain-containing protein [Lachnospiraceae bacterium]|nr:GGDEF domain-containing protein [Lachnospiraceae bacterium]